MAEQLFEDKLVGELLHFLRQSPTPFHATRNLSARFEQAGFSCLDEARSWSLEPGGSYYVTRDDASVIAFRLGNSKLSDSGFRLVGTHTDSPCLRIKPAPVFDRHGYTQLGIEVYGGALYGPWFDRDLALAGRVEYETVNGEKGAALVDSVRPVATIPSLAIHLDREANTSRSINAESQLPPVLMLSGDSESKFDFDAYLLTLLRDQPGHESAGRVLSHEISLYDTQAPAVLGINNEFLAGARLDNLLSSFIAASALISCKADAPSLVVCNNHEEVGSMSSSGAQGTFLKSVLARLNEALAPAGTGLAESQEIALRRSVMVSADNTHGIHPNFASKHDDLHKPLINGGPAIKVNANQRYASATGSIAVFRAVCERLDVPVQQFVNRADLACGSTIGPITAAETGIPTVDIGVPTFAMHSIRELGGTRDPAYLCSALAGFFERVDQSGS